MNIFVGNIGNEDVLFIYGFIFLLVFWIEMVFLRLLKFKYRLFVVDFLGFGKSFKFVDLFYMMREYVEMIEKLVLFKYNVKLFYIVVYFLGCILVFGLVVKYGGFIKLLIFFVLVSKLISLYLNFYKYNMIL